MIIYQRPNQIKCRRGPGQPVHSPDGYWSEAECGRAVLHRQPQRLKRESAIGTGRHGERNGTRQVQAAEEEGTARQGKRARQGKARQGKNAIKRETLRMGQQQQTKR